MNLQKTYQRKTTGQWLMDAQVCESQSGRNEIYLAKGVIAREAKNGMIIESTSDGPLAVLSLSDKQNQRLCELISIRDWDHDAWGAL